MVHNLIIPKTVYSGVGSLEKLSHIFRKEQYRKAVIFTYAGITETNLLSLVRDELQKVNAEYVIIDDLAVEPSIQQAKETVAQFQKFDADVILAVGGGSVMDVAKLASILAGSQYSIEDLVKDPSVGRKMIPTIMIPTTAGTGSEATPNSIVTDVEKQLKIGIINDAMIADYVILAPEMLRKIPQKIAASTGIDALAHAIECFTSKKATPFSDLFALEAVKLIFANVEVACDMEQRTDEALTAMLEAAFYGGVAIANSGTTAVHALSYPLGGRYHIAHGVANAILLEPVMRFNMDACAEKLALVYDAIYAKRDLNTQEKAEFIIERLAQIVRNLNIPTSLVPFGVQKSDLEALVEAGMDVKRLLSNNVKALTESDARKLYQQILQ